MKLGLAAAIHILYREVRGAFPLPRQFPLQVLGVLLLSGLYGVDQKRGEEHSHTGVRAFARVLEVVLDLCAWAGWKW